MNTCPKCGNPVEEEKAFCPTCGESMMPERVRTSDSEEEEMGETFVSFEETDRNPPPAAKLSKPSPPASAATPPATPAQPVATPTPVTTPPPVKVSPPNIETTSPVKAKLSAAAPASDSSYRQPPAAQRSAPAVSNRMLYVIFAGSAILFALSIVILVYLYIKGRI
jgi:hypothetical protein